MSILLSFDRPIPKPFDSKNKIVKVSSKHGDGTQSTLCCTVVKAIMSYCDCFSGVKSGAVGVIDHRTVAEYKSSAGPDDYHVVVYDPTKGNFIAGCFNKSSELIEKYQVHKSARDGAALVFAMIPALIRDDEFKTELDAYAECHGRGFPDLEEARKHMAILCDNVYRRIEDPTNAEALVVNIEKTGNILPIRSAQMDAQTFKPQTVLAGEFTILAKSGTVPVQVAATVVEHETFIGQYALDTSRKLSSMEMALIPEIPSWHILTKEVVDICKHAQFSSSMATPMRNFLLRGPAGTGKTHDARAVAAGLGLPYVKFTCSADTDVYDFIGQVYPDFSSSTGDPLIDAELKQLDGMGGVTYENVQKLLGLPDPDDMDFDPEGAFERMTGVSKPGVSLHDCISVALSLVTDKVTQLTSAKYAAGSDGPSYNYFETDFLRGLKNGYVIEIQEPANITQPGVLTGLNDLLEQAGTILLPDNRRINRHPDAVIIITTNVNYEGCRPLNQSVLDRMDLIMDIPLPDEATMCQRAMSVTGCEDEIMVTHMVKVVADMADYCQKNGVTDGNVGMRGLIDWIISTKCTGNPYRSALDTVISRATADEEEQATLIASYLEPYFSSGGSTQTA